MIRILVYLNSLVFVLVSISCVNQTDFPILKGPYLGQKPPGVTPELFAPGIISTEQRELNSVFSPKGNDFYFAVYTSEPTDNCVIMHTELVEGTWTKPEVASFSGRYIDVDMAFSPDGNKLYFCSKRPDESEDVRESKHDIWFCSRSADNNWSKPQKLEAPINSEESETYPCFAQNGKMYFASSRRGGYGGTDIYYSQQIDGEFSEPVNIGSIVNTQYREGDPFIASDESYLIFSSGGRPDCIGGGDLYISFKKKDSSWTVPKNMGEPINTEVFEYSPVVSPEGKYLFFSRYSEGVADIYWVKTDIVEEMKQDILE